MATQLKGNVINMKSLSQDIKDPIVVGGGESNGRWLTVIFTQEAAAQFSEETHVYLSWRHIQKNIKGYNVFKEIPREDTDELTAEEQPPMWQIYFSDTMLSEGDILARIELVDDISVSASTNFTIKVLAEPWDGTDWIKNDDLSEFKIAINRAQRMQQQIDDNHQEILNGLNYLYNMFNVNPFEDVDGDGNTDNPEPPDNYAEMDNEGDITISEWTGEG